MEITRFEDIIGHEDVIAHMKRAIELDRVSHAYILSGPEGCGKKTLASVFAMSLLCENRRGGGPVPCGTCTSCRKAMSGNHPDIIYVRHAKDTVLSVDEVREQIGATAQIRPYESERKIYIIDDADLMNPQAQNALLKTIEEPPEYAIFLLLTVGTEPLLPTIRSRCVLLSLHPVSPDRIADYLSHTYALSDEDAAVIAAFAQGSVGMAKEAASGEEFSRRLEEGIRFLSKMPDMSARACVDMARKMAPDKADLYEYFHIFQMWLRDVLYFKASKDPDGLVFRGRTIEISRQAEHCSYEGLEDCLKALETAETRVRANVDREVTLELLFLTLLENL